ncbi:hypothetical protein B0T19DRAFT_270893 [Cercophora scortea]|uniref:Secreted protein n=1 Tax=Cercophora scortea TaxID=314031 RepID=A0AAE0I8N4_9PEZI|nr:hypothetical protein B0T19DRAFT_270893 [Cercophora scortea]
MPWLLSLRWALSGLVRTGATDKRCIVDNISKSQSWRDSRDGKLPDVDGRNEVVSIWSFGGANQHTSGGNKAGKGAAVGGTGRDATLRCSSAASAPKLLACLTLRVCGQRLSVVQVA